MIALVKMGRISTLGIHTECFASLNLQLSVRKCLFTNQYIRALTAKSEVQEGSSSFC